ncbi:DUF2182 domain-containing protein [Halobacterium bonnevillei]|uniref:DUF2182 domain-containing protein n=1 Tax=Halobacterium bonnevillei TaxID=2692200 RepID=A0A6B0SI21_9EURY|nr:DUF2182 domain-containing protein [Halobacterium bonnevillei]MXR19521.1 DUF2182 domain-containing protein [Halobacterium bonnevillei]
MRTPARWQFDHRRIPVVAIVTYGIAVIAWVAIVRRWLPMPGSVPGLQMTDPGGPEAMALSNGLAGLGLYVGMWGVMMVAMMYPSTVPLFRMYYRTLDGTTNLQKATRVSAFLGTYALIWALTGVVPLLVNAAVPIAVVADGHGMLLLGGTLVLASLYQLSPYKRRCLQYCRTPLGFLMEYHQPGVSGAARMSFRFSVFCVGCCWALFAVLVVVGSMNILWMAGITAILSAERVLTWGDRVAKGIGVASGVTGVAAVLVALV